MRRPRLHILRTISLDTTRRLKGTRNWKVEISLTGRWQDATSVPIPDERHPLVVGFGIPHEAQPQPGVDGL
jgi:hypothetical protein